MSGDLQAQRGTWGSVPQSHSPTAGQHHLTYHPVLADDHGLDDLVLEVHRDEQRWSNCRENSSLSEVKELDTTCRAARQSGVWASRGR